MKLLDKYWAGSADTFNAVNFALAKQTEFTVSLRAAANSGSEEAMPSLWDKRDGVAVVDIAGSLVAGSAGWMRYFGVVGYDDIQAALVEAASDPEVKSILLHVSSGGGAVSGVDDLAAFIKRVDAVKPVVTYAAGTMASAAYWLGSGGRYVMASQTSIVGSIGVLMVHMEYSKQMQEEGVTATVIRAGKFKALVNSVEPLSEEALAQAESQAAHIYDIFTGRVAANRSASVAKVEADMAQGREFIGRQALTAGLIDKVATYEQAFNYAKKLDNGSTSGNNTLKKGAQTMKASLTESQLAALASGATLEAVAGDIDVTDTAVTETPTVAAVEVPVTQEVTADATATTFAALADQVVASKTQVSTLTAELAASKELQTQLTASNDALLTVVRQAGNRMQIALGSSGMFDSLDAKAAVTEYSKVSETFNTKFKAGGVAVSAQDNKGEPSVTKVDPMFLQLVKAAQTA